VDDLLGSTFQNHVYRIGKWTDAASGARLAEEVANAPLRACVLLEYIVILQFFTPI
jgi:hypothetical protein